MTNCQRRRNHKARVGEVVTVTRVGEIVECAVLIGDNGEDACIPHQGCRLMVEETVTSGDPEVKQLQPLDMISYIQARFLRIFRRDLFLLPTGREVKLSKLEGFKLRLMSSEFHFHRPPVKDIVAQADDILRQSQEKVVPLRLVR